MNTEPDDLSRLRLTLLKHQWKESYPIALMLLAQDVPNFTVFVAEQMMRSYLRFRSEDNLEWAAAFAHEVTRYVQKGQTEDKMPQLPDEAHEASADTPFGLGGFVSGCSELEESLLKTYDKEEKAKHLVYALDRLIVSEISNYWVKRYPEEIQLRQKFFLGELHIGKNLRNDVDKEKLYRGISFLKQPESLGYRTARWLSIADEIELRLNK